MSNYEPDPPSPSPTLIPNPIPNLISLPNPYHKFLRTSAFQLKDPIPGMIIAHRIKKLS